jgi:hypothetical protein
VVEQISASSVERTGPSYAPPSSVPYRVTVPGVPGAVASFLDLSSSGQENIYFAKGRYLASVVTICASRGGASCDAGLTVARRQYAALPG